MPRKAPFIDPLSPPGVRRTIVGRLISREELAKKGAWGREIKLLTKLQKTYSDDRFWLQLKPAMKLETLAYFLGYGAAALREEWQMFQYAQAEKQNLQQYDLDRASMLSMMESTKEEPSAAPLKKRETLIDWADSAGGGI